MTSRRATALLCAALAAVTITVGGCSAARPATEPKYGSLPDFLPKSSLQADGMLVGTTAHPALTSQGDEVEVHTTSGTVIASVQGPLVPGDGLPYQTKATTCTWLVTLHGATTDIPIRVSDFSAIDHLGKEYLARVLGVAPKVVHAGQTVSFELRAVMTVGEGLMRWAPNGRDIVAKWDFVVEND